MIKDSLGSAKIGVLIKPETMEMSAWASWSYRLCPGGDKKTKTQNPFVSLLHQLIFYRGASESAALI